MEIPFRMCRLPKTIFICALIGVVFWSVMLCCSGTMQPR